LRWKYAWMKPIFGWKIAKRAQRLLPQMKSALGVYLDGIMYRLETHETPAGNAAKSMIVTHKDRK